MRRLMIIASIASLAACSKPAEEAPVATEAAVAAATESPAGDYTVTNKDNKVGKLNIAADNSYTFTPPEGDAVKGMVSNKDGKACYDPEGDKAATVCWTNGEPAADGTWVATSDDGQTVTAARVTS
jgi:hypothetical protein